MPTCALCGLDFEPVYQHPGVLDETRCAWCRSVLHPLRIERIAPCPINEGAPDALRPDDLGTIPLPTETTVMGVRFVKKPYGVWGLDESRHLDQFPPEQRREVMIQNWRMLRAFVTPAPAMPAARSESV